MATAGSTLPVDRHANAPAAADPTQDRDRHEVDPRHADTGAFRTSEDDGGHYASPLGFVSVRGPFSTSSMVNPAASASASTRVTNARSRRSRSRGGCAWVGVALMNDPTPRRVSMTPARSSSPYTRATVLALISRAHRELPHGRQLIAGAEAAGGNRRAQATFELRVNRRRVAWVDRDDVHVD